MTFLQSPGYPSIEDWRGPSGPPYLKAHAFTLTRKSPRLPPSIGLFGLRYDSGQDGSLNNNAKRKKELMEEQEYRELLESCAAHSLEDPTAKWQELIQALSPRQSFLALLQLVLAQRKLAQSNRSGSVCPRGRPHGASPKQELGRSAFPLSISDLKLPRDKNGEPMGS